MAVKKKKTVLSTALTIIIIAAIIWMKYNETHLAKEREGGIRDKDIVLTHPDEKSSSKSSEGLSEISSRLTPVSLTSSKFEVLESCTLIDHRGNDGDSFHVMTPKGRQELRIYYVDAPESAARSYRNGDTNHQRIAEQGASMGRLNQKQTTQVGVEAKLFTKKLLKGKKFRVATNWESVYNSRRKYAYIIVQWEGQERYLHELLVSYGLGRIHTKPMTLPDNTSSTRHKTKLRSLEAYAKKMRYGAWGIR